MEGGDSELNQDLLDPSSASRFLATLDESFEQSHAHFYLFAHVTDDSGFKKHVLNPRLK